MVRTSPSPSSPDVDTDVNSTQDVPAVAKTFLGTARARLNRRKFERTVPHSATYHLAAGTAAGVVTTVMLYPLDLIKTRYQVYDQGPSPYGNLRTAFRLIVKSEGYSGLYQGLVPALTGNAIAWGGFFYCYEQTKVGSRRFMLGHTGNGGLRPVHHLGSGMVAGAAMVFVTNPVWMIKTRMQLQDKAASMSGTQPYRSFSDAFVTILREEGPRALYKGVVPALVLCSQGAVQFTAYEWLKARVPESDKNTPVESLVMGGTSKAVASLVTYPAQVIKSRLQQRSSKEELKQGVVRYRGMLHCAVMMAKSEGVRGFFKGCVPYALRAAPASAITFVVYEEVLKVLNQGKSRAPLGSP
ncbi:unnamed protein product [Choristocarpus tenellus]